MTGMPFLHVGLALVLAPLLPGLINKVKALITGRTGAPLLQVYFDLARLLRKGTVYSETTTVLFRIGPVLALATTLVSLGLLPLGAIPAIVHFNGDFILLAYVLGLGRFFTLTAALDTGSAFEGMGASREAQISLLAEPALMMAFLTLAVMTGHTSITDIAQALETQSPAAIFLVLATLSAVFLAENARIPVDDPTTHLELTMVHEVMVLDHSGPDLAFIEYGSSLKLWVLGVLTTSVLFPGAAKSPAESLVVGVGLLLALAVIVGVIESFMTRTRVGRVPHLLVGSAVLSTVALFLVWS